MNFQENEPKYSGTNEVHPNLVKAPTVKPIVTYVIFGFTIFIFLLQFGSRLIFSGKDYLFILGGKINPLILAGQLWRLITPVFLHGSIMHLVFNMYVLFILGRRIESTYGHFRFLTLYFLAAFGGNVLSFVLSDANSIGASTAIFGLIAADGIFIFQNRKLFGPRTRGMLLNLGIFLIFNLLIGFMPELNIDYFGHLGGLLAGFIFSAIGGPHWKIEGDGLVLSLRDFRPKKDIWLAAIIVLIGFVVMAAIPFM